MGTITRRGMVRRPNETMRLIVTTFISVVFGLFLGVSFPTISLTKMNLPSTLLPSIDLGYIEDKYSGLSSQALLNIWSSIRRGEGILSHEPEDTKIWVPTNPRGAERLPPGVVASESDLYLRRLYGSPSEDLIIKPRYLVTFTVGYEQKDNIDNAVKKFSENFTILLFHYDGRTSEWNEFEWSKRAIHVSVLKQTKWYINLVKKHGLEISQPGLSANSGLTWQMTRKRDDSEVHKEAEERDGWCTDPHLPPCAAFVEIMAPVFSRNAWRCVWHMIQNDLVHGWGLDFALRRCVEGTAENGKAPWEGVRERCQKEWTTFQIRMTLAERAYLKMTNRLDQLNSTNS
ncbi:Protein of unknown function DUF707 [Cynara cardunculus var. scolymus]|uniref:Uncharacterized protein n=1 Tax=Cynara cardunculus var. scolymus TaxID=59895 RepID=A0A124SF91_CYNCS|nr:Protein of unknown function DUF707 [Cynara cardunculus var. scolymus]